MRAGRKEKQTSERKKSDEDELALREIPKDVVEFARNLLQFDPDEKQSEVLRANTHRVLVCCTRQWGKSTVAALAAVHHMLTRARAFVVVIAPTERQGAELVQKARDLMQRAGVAVKRDGRVRHSLVVTANGSRMIALPSTNATSRCYGGVTLMIVDEAATVADEVIDAAWPFLAVTNGSLWMVGTPNGQQGRFWETWQYDVTTGWVRFAVKAEECPRIPKEFLEEERRRGERRYRQEYGCEFLDTEGSVFNVRLLLERVSEEFAPLEV
jgi:hypothetical protein